MSRIPTRGAPRQKPSIVMSTSSTTTSAIGPPRAPVPKAPIAARSSTLFKKQVFKEALGKAALDPKHRVYKVGADRRKVEAPIVNTKRGPERVLKQVVLEKTLQRTPKAEYISRNVTGIKAGPSGKGTMYQISAHSIDPTHAPESAGVNEAIVIRSSLSVTAGGKQTERTVQRSTVKAESLLKKMNMNPTNINRLVKEESEDVEHTLKMAPPDLVSDSISRFPLRKKLHNLRINSDSIALLNKMVSIPPPTADEAQKETPPDTIAAIMEAVEKGASPKTAPHQIFNTLFPNVQDESISLSSVAPGPLADIVIPTTIPKDINEEVLSEEMETSIRLVQNIETLPEDDICWCNNITAQERTPKGSNKTPILIEEQIPPWNDEDVMNVSFLVGGEPIDSIESADTSALENTQDLLAELAKGIDYFLDAETVLYETKVQLRGSKFPTWFPGYMSVFPHLPDLVKVSECPIEVLNVAWKTVQPKIFPNESIVTV